MTPSPPAARRLSHRRGSMVAPDPFRTEPLQEAVSSSSRITIVRVPNQQQTGPRPPSPGVHSAKDGFPPRSDRDPSGLARRSSWGSNRSASSASSGHGPAGGRVSFAFASFTPIVPPGGSNSGAYTPSTSGPPSPTATFSRSKRSNSNPPLAQLQHIRAASLTPQQLYEVAQQATNPGVTSPGGVVYGYGGRPATPGPTSAPSTPSLAPFTPLPSEVYLPFIHRPQEVSHLFSTLPTARLYALLASTFPQAPISRPPSAASTSHMSTSSASSTMHISDLPEDPKQWSFGQLSFWIKCVNRQEANDKEWVKKIRICVNSRSEALWQRLAGALGVPAGFDEIDEDMSALDDDYDDAMSHGHGPQDTVERHEEGNTAEAGDSFEELEVDEDPGVVVEPITASSISHPTPAGAGSLQGVQEEQEIEEPAFGGSGRSMEDIKESEEISSGENSGGASPREGIASTSPTLPTLDSFSNKHGKAPALPHHILGLQVKHHIPKASSPLAASSKMVSAPKDTHHAETGKSSAEITSGSQGAHDPTPLAGPSTEQGIDFTEADLSGEPIQGLRISNASMMFVVGGNATPASHTVAVAGASPSNPTTTRRFSHGSHGAHIAAPDTRDPASTGPHPVTGTSVYQRPRNFSTGSAQGVFPTHLRNASASSLHGVQAITYSTQTTGKDQPGHMADGEVGGLNHDAYQERGPGAPLFPSSFAGLSVNPTLSANNPGARYPPPPQGSAYPYWKTPSGHCIPRLGAKSHRRWPSWAEGFEGEGTDYAITVASGSSDAGRG